MILWNEHMIQRNVENIFTARMRGSDNNSKTVLRQAL